MISGVSGESYARAATFAGITGTWDSDYPVENMADLVRITKVARVTPAAGAAAFSVVLPASTSISFSALVNHTAPEAATMRVRAYSDAGMTAGIYDSAAVSMGPVVSGYPSVRPLVYDAVTARAVRVDLADLDGDTEIGGFEISKFWRWSGISPGADVSLLAGSGDVDLAGGGSMGDEAWQPRTYDGQIDFLALALAQTTGFDFQKITARGRPFVFVEDYSDPDSWPRGCFLARNGDLPALVGAVYRHDRFQFRFREHDL